MELWFFDLHVEKKKIFQSVKPWFLVFHIKKKKKNLFQNTFLKHNPFGEREHKGYPHCVVPFSSQPRKPTYQYTTSFTTK